MALLSVRELSVVYQTQRGTVRAVDDVSLAIEEREAFGLVGESGCGKTTLALALLGLLPRNGRIRSGEILFQETDLASAPRDTMRHIRWKGISMVFQAAMNSLNPVQRVGDQIVEAIRAHEAVTHEEGRQRVRELFQLVGLDPDHARAYPHQYSGGMKQRAIIAMALACRPALVIADEPTTALDVIMQDQILAELVRLQTRMGMAMLYISHDIAIISESCQRVGVMYAGSMVECGPGKEVFSVPLHPYMQALLGSYPSLRGKKGRLASIAGELPNLIDPPPGCKFHPRCAHAMAVCRRKVPVYGEIKPGRWVACHLHAQA
jgi:peptide/nickel transport system ATP-binding protein